MPLHLVMPVGQLCHILAFLEEGSVNSAVQKSFKEGGTLQVIAPPYIPKGGGIVTMRHLGCSTAAPC